MSRRTTTTTTDLCATEISGSVLYRRAVHNLQNASRETYFVWKPFGARYRQNVSVRPGGVCMKCPDGKASGDDGECDHPRYPFSLFTYLLCTRGVPC